ncbi:MULTISPECIES: glycoside hydrolase family 38 C-terminal domain-containing protein [unclassified Oceanispirochaeta]|uniref:alpha-mannosidase n=1 Tax=unclassified Oceanispirochaeta TaxID=2635722 RepID=UPI0018F5A6EA|nr:MULTISPECIES: glycoside hydrolase family 38 C-terminal domain-containing protein [unclassified Oceanispirochaeta]
MAKNKKYNRQSEFLFQDAEFLSVFAKEAGALQDYPEEKLHIGWELILLNQFHDILPGTSIKKVYEDSHRQYEEVLRSGYEMVSAAASGIASMITSDCNSLVVFNQLSFTRSDMLVFESEKNISALDAGDGELTPVQKTGDNSYTAFVGGIPSKGYKTFSFVESGSPADKRVFTYSNGKLETPFYSVLFDDQGHITSLFDKEEERELTRKGCRLNQLQAFEDKPHNYDAWDINIYYQDKMWTVNDLISREVIENGPLRFCLKITREFMDSSIEQKIVFYKEKRRIDFDNKIDWKENHILLKAAFPLDIHASKATYEIQYGNVERSTHSNTSWDVAQFEVCSHKWADLSEGNYGVSLLNDCKYGYDIKDGTMRLSLIKSAIEPNPDADKEIHEFTYSLYPHRGQWQDARTVQEAYSLNCPLYSEEIAVQRGTLGREECFASVDRDNILIEVIKKAEDRDEIIIRLYECYNRRTNTDITFAQSIESLCECDLHENKGEELWFDGKIARLSFKPYEIKTLNLKLSGGV